jgi:hypothetical protein
VDPESSPTDRKVGNIRSSRTGRESAALGALAVVVGLVSLNWPANSFDEQLLLVDPLRMMQGDLPYREFGTAYGPTHWWLLEGLYRVWSPTVVAERTLGLAVHVLIVVATYRVAVGLRPRNGVLSGGVAIALLFPLGIAPYAWLSAVALCLVALAVLQRAHGRPPWLFAAGLVTTLAVGFRPDAALLAALSGIPLLLGSPGRRWWLLGAALGSTPVAVSVALTPTGAMHDILLGRGTSAVRQSRLPLIPPDMTTILLSALIVVTISTAAAAAVLIREIRLMSVVGLGIAALPEALQRADETHLLYAALVAVPLLPQTVQALAERLPPGAGRPSVLAARLSTLVVLIGAGSTFVPLALQVGLTGVPHTESVHHDGRSLLVEPAQARGLRELEPVLSALHQPGRTLFVYDANLTRPALTDLAVYYLWPSYEQHAHNLDVAPGASNSPRSGLAKDIAAADVLVLVSISDEGRRALFPYARDGDGEPARLVAQDFCHVKHVAFYEVLRRCSGPEPGEFP